MLIIAGKLYVNPSERDTFVEGHRDVVERSRKQPGCLDLAVSADPLEENRVNMYELWESEELLDAWRAVAGPPSVSVEILGGDVQKHQISSSGPPF